MKGEHLGPDDPSERMRAEERHRLALYLHDHVGQILTLTKLQLARIQQALREPVDPAKQAWLQTIVDSLIPELDAVMQTLQEEVFVLSPTGLTEVGLTAMLEQECVGFSRRTGIPCDSRCESLNLDGQRSALVVLIVREALSNVARHSRATTAEVILQRSGKHGILSVRDNGMRIRFDSHQSRRELWRPRHGGASADARRGAKRREYTDGRDMHQNIFPSGPSSEKYFPP